MQVLVNNKNEIKDEVSYLPVDKILPNPYQARKFFDPASLDELAVSIKKYGVIKPLIVREINNDIYELISGERRLKACKMLGFTKVPTFVKNVADRESVLLALVENIQREELNFFEEAESFQRLMVDFGYDIESIASFVGKNSNIVLESLMILSLKKEIKSLILENKLTKDHAKLITTVEDGNLQLEILQKVIKYKLNADHTKKLIDKAIKKEKIENLKKTQKIKGIIRDIRLFTNTIQNAIDIMKQSGIDTKYSINKEKDGYEINIKVFMQD